jgi:hypothetical protein
MPELERPLLGNPYSWSFGPSYTDWTMRMILCASLQIERSCTKRRHLSESDV